jgi:hypothetical protein
MPRTTRYPFEVPYDTVEADVDRYIDAVFGALQSSFLVVPRGAGFVTYPAFQRAYEVLKRGTTGFREVNPSTVMSALEEDPLAFLVLRAIVGLTPSELAYLCTRESRVTVSQSFARGLDRSIRIGDEDLRSTSAVRRKRIQAMVAVACRLLKMGAVEAPNDAIHRLDKADTVSGLASLRHVVSEGVPYSMLLYERYLGRPFASHRDSVSELVGEVMENAVEAHLRAAGISFRKTRRAERVQGFDQAPDFIIPDEWSPRVVIEAKITEDDGTARDKVTRIQHLAEMGRRRGVGEGPGFSVIACIDGRGFGVRREDMRKLLEATRGKIFTLRSLPEMVEYSELAAYKCRD